MEAQAHQAVAVLGQDMLHQGWGRWATLVVEVAAAGVVVVVLLLLLW